MDLYLTFHYFCEPFTTYVTLFSLVNLVIVLNCTCIYVLYDF
jgi:hypothetical protein